MGNLSSDDATTAHSHTGIRQQDGRVLDPKSEDWGVGSRTLGVISLLGNTMDKRHLGLCPS